MSEACECRKALEAIAAKFDSDEPVTGIRALVTAALAAPCECEQLRAERDQRTRELFLEACDTKQLRADLKEAVDALEPFGRYLTIPDDLREELRAALPIAAAVFDRAVAVFAKHRPAPGA